MKVSKYNFFFQGYNENYYAYNGLSGGVLRVSQEVSQKIQEILSHLENSSVKIDEHEKDIVWNYLCQGSFILDDKVDELEILKARNRMVRFSGNRLYLNIAVTNSCNFRCKYCFQEHSAESMSPQVADLLVDFVATSINSCEELCVHWYGGEPLLNLPIIRDVSSSFKNICQASNCNYTACISTNGFLLNQETVNELIYLNVKSIRVTLDGPSEIHDKRRPLINGAGTFSTILENITAATKYTALTLRVNIDRDNISYLPELLKILYSRGLNKKIFLEFVPVTPFTSNYQSNCYTAVEDRELTYVIKNISKEAMSLGFRLVSQSLTTARHCVFDDVNSFLINNDGKIYKCSMDEKFCVGQLDNLDSGKLQLNYSRWLNLISMDPFDDLECRNCRILPLCMGGCTLKRMTFGKESICPVWKSDPEEHLLLNICNKEICGNFP